MRGQSGVFTALLLAAVAVHAVHGEHEGRIKEIPDGPYQKYSAQPLVNLGGTFYYFEANVQTNWYAALEFCRNIGLHLAAIESEEQNTLIVDHIASIGYSSFWISGNDFSSSDVFIWASTGKRAIFTDWHPGEPNNSRGDACIQLRFNNGVVKWNDEDPYELNHFICQQICDASCTP